MSLHCPIGKRFISRLRGRIVDISRYNPEIVPFRYSPIEITEKFYDWCKINTPFLFKRQLNLRPCYLPFWCIEHKVTSTFEGLTQSTDYVPWKERSDDYESIRDATFIYAGSNIRRQLLDIIKCDLKSSTKLNQGQIDRDIPLEEVFLSEEIAWKRIQEQSIDCDATRIQHFLLSTKRPLTNVVSVCEKTATRLIYLPAYICEYKFRFHTFKVFFSGYSGEGFGIPQDGVLRAAAEKFDTLLLPNDRNWINLIFKAPFIFLFCIFTSFSSMTNSVNIMKKTYRDWFQIQKEDHLFDSKGENEFVSKSDNIKAKPSQKPDPECDPISIIRDDHDILNPLRNHYEVLRVPVNATTEEIKFAFQKIIQKYHPDTCLSHQGIPTELAEDISKRVIKAYNILKDPVKRQEYDKWI